MNRDIHVRPLTEEWIEALREFNRRMVAGGLPEDLAFPEPSELEFPFEPGRPIYQEQFIAVEGSSVRGGYYLTNERCTVAGSERQIANFRHPISEVVIDKRFKGLSSQLVMDAIERLPLLYAVGFGSANNPNLKRLRSEDWEACEIPFLFRVHHVNAFLDNIQPLRRKRHLRIAADVARWTGAGWTALKTAQALRGLGGARHTSAEVVSDFDTWADEIWSEASRGHLYLGFRDLATLRYRYAPSRRSFTRLKISRGGEPVGWAVVLQTPMKNNKYFGDLNVGTIVDCLAVKGSERAVLSHAASELERAGVDVVVTNQSAGEWVRAAAQCGFWSGPSNYLMACSPGLIQAMGAPLESCLPRMHLTRGDGAGISRL